MSITVEQVNRWLAQHPATPHTPQQQSNDLSIIVDAVNACVRRWHGYTLDESWTPSHELGAVMLAARLSRRRLTPGGTEHFAELGVGMIQRSDPDASMLLGLGAWSTPRVG